MKKMRIVTAALIVATLMAAGCGSKEADFDVAALGNDLSTSITYVDTLSEMDLDTAGMFLNLADINVNKAAIYEGSGGTAEEIVVLECATADDAKKRNRRLRSVFRSRSRALRTMCRKNLPNLMRQL